ncbi:LysE/ArgO family amino acid transporter [Pelistega europaea]|uniref:Amino acid transporter n=1 Tax=Pelistega europaea TaxID=106147 RepID=A0A7Y4LBI3_9BURK|nr:LysE/ArgO family amino acid transporter [Pelistega europaea]NOL50495.1 amino acid transporter [Pelistega europaea]
MSTAFISGFLLCLSLIVAIGSQNAFIIKQGLKKEHTFWISFLCTIFDMIIIGIGTFGFGHIILSLPWALTAMQYIGAAFLFVYGLLHLKSAFKGGQSLQTDAEQKKMPLKKAVLIICALTWLNPHVYIDCFFIIGSVATKYAEHRMAFYLGNITASTIFFFALGYGARLLQPIFKKPLSWQILDFIIFVIMVSIAYSLIMTDIPTPSTLN